MFSDVKLRGSEIDNLYLVSSLRLNGVMSQLPVYGFLVRKDTILLCTCVINTSSLIHGQHNVICDYSTL